MAASPVSARNARPEPFSSPTRGRGVPKTVTMRATTAIAPLLEAQSLCAEVIAAAGLIQTAAAVGSRQMIANEAGRLGSRAEGYRKRFHVMAGELER